jgi:hypothetical protein
VKQQHHIAPSVHPQQKQAQTMKQLKQHIKLVAYSNQLVKWSIFMIMLRGL